MTKKVHFGLQELQLEEVDIVNVVDSSFVYPSFKSLKDKEMTEMRDSLEVNFSLPIGNVIQISVNFPSRH